MPNASHLHRWSHIHLRGYTTLSRDLLFQPHRNRGHTRLAQWGRSARPLVILIVAQIYCKLKLEWFSLFSKWNVPPGQQSWNWAHSYWPTLCLDPLLLFWRSPGYSFWWDHSRVAQKHPDTWGSMPNAATLPDVPVSAPPTPPCASSALSPSSISSVPSLPFPIQGVVGKGWTIKAIRQVEMNTSSQSAAWSDPFNWSHGWASPAIQVSGVLTIFVPIRRRGIKCSIYHYISVFILD